MSSKQVRKNTKQHSSSFNKKTLDIQHTSKLTEFSKVQEEIAEIKEHIKDIDTRIETFKERQRHGYDAPEDEILLMLALRDERDALNKNLQETYEKDEVEYFVNTAPILFQYYDIVEKGNDDQSLADTKDNILKFFTSKPEVIPEVEVPEFHYNDRASLLDKYMLLTDENYVKTVEAELKEKCVHCGSSDRNIMLNEGFVHCNHCDSIEYIIIDHDRPSYKEIPREVTYFSYKRINHLNEFRLQSMIRRLKLIIIFSMNLRI